MWAGDFAEVKRLFPSLLPVSGLAIDPMQKWPPLIFVTEKNYLLTEIYYFTDQVKRNHCMKF